MLHISKTTETEILQLYKLERLCHRHPWTLGILQDCLNVGYLCHTFRLSDEFNNQNTIATLPIPNLQKKHCCINPIGFMMNQIILDECHLLTICVHPELQGKGIAQTALEWLISVLCEQEMMAMFLEVWVANLPAIKLYEKLGFKKIRIRKNYYEYDTGSEDAMVMKLNFFNKS